MIGKAANRAEAVLVVDEPAVPLVLLDVQMRSPDGFNRRNTRAAYPGDHVFVLYDVTQLQTSQMYRERLDRSPQ